MSVSQTEQHAALNALVNTAMAEVAQTDSLRTLDDLRVKYLGKKGLLTEQLKQIATLPHDLKKDYGNAVNEAKRNLEIELEKSRNSLKEKEILEKIQSESVDISLPERQQESGSMHPISQALSRMQGIFMRLGFDIATGPEIEHEFYNFEALNMPADHPARAMHDTFYINQEMVLRTHTSPVQVRYMQEHEPPIRVIAPGRVYRCDSDATHTPMFNQIEGLAIDRDIHFGDLKGMLTYFLNEYFESDSKIRLRPSYFPFTEPSAEFDIECVFCKGSGCRICKSTGWLEVGGCGMVHPVVLKHGGIDSDKYSGYAFGLGVERLAMLRYGINDLRLMFENDLAFLRQF